MNNKNNNNSYSDSDRNHYDDNKYDRIKLTIYKISLGNPNDIL
jgi:hypothetical protein